MTVTLSKLGVSVLAVLLFALVGVAGLTGAYLADRAEDSGESEPDIAAQNLAEAELTRDTINAAIAASREIAGLLSATKEAYREKRATATQQSRELSIACRAWDEDYREIDRDLWPTEYSLVVRGTNLTCSVVRGTNSQANVMGNVAAWEATLFDPNYDPVAAHYGMLADLPDLSQAQLLRAIQERQ